MSVPFVEIPQLPPVTELPESMVPCMDLKGCGGLCVLLGAMPSLMLQPPNILPSGKLT